MHATSRKPLPGNGKMTNRRREPGAAPGQCGGRRPRRAGRCTDAVHRYATVHDGARRVHGAPRTI